MIQWINRKRNKKGFTLIELIVVIAILGILAAIAIPRLSGFTSTAKINANKNNMATYLSVIKVYQADTGTLPANLAAIQVEKYLGAGAPPVPRVVTDANFGAAVGNVFWFDASDVAVKIGTAGGDTGDFAISGGAVD